MKAQQDILGHSDIHTTMRYAHAITEQSLEAIETLSHCKRTNSLIIRNRQFDYFGHPCSKIVQIMSD